MKKILFALFFITACAHAQSGTKTKYIGANGIWIAIQDAIAPTDTGTLYLPNDAKSKMLMAVTPRSLSSPYNLGDLPIASSVHGYLSLLTFPSVTSVLYAIPGNGYPNWQPITSFPSIIDTNYVLSHPNGATFSDHNTIEPTADVSPLWLQGYASGASNLFECLYNSGMSLSPVFTIDPTGSIISHTASDVVLLDLTAFGGSVSDAMQLNGLTVIDHFGNLSSYNGINAGSATVPGYLQLQDGAGLLLRIRAPAMSSTTDWYWPNADGSPNQVMKTDGAGNLGWASAGMANPMTTLGDIIYEDATPAPARLAGNTAAIQKVLVQTGTGAVSAAPSWTSSPIFTFATIQPTTGGSVQIKFDDLNNSGFNGLLIATSTISANRSWTLPNSSGTVALTTLAGGGTGTTTGATANIGGAAGALAASTTYYSIPAGLGATAAAISQTEEILVSYAATISNLRVRCVAPGAGQTTQFTIYKNGAATAVTCTVSGGSTTAADVTNSFTVTAGDRLSIEIITSTTSATTKATWGFRING